MTPALRRTFDGHPCRFYTDADLIQRDHRHRENLPNVRWWLYRHAIDANLVHSVEVRGPWAAIRVYATDEDGSKVIAKNTDTPILFEQIFKVRYPVPTLPEENSYG